MHRDILPRVIFSPAQLALDLTDGLVALGADVTLFTPGPVSSNAKNIVADLSLFDAELAGRGYDYVTLLKKHPQVFIALARQVQAELLAAAYQMANDDKLDVVHVYTNEEELGLVFARFCKKPVIYTHHDPFNFLIKYKSIMPKYAHLPWLSMSYAQRKSMPAHTNWVANIYHGLDPTILNPIEKPTRGYVAYFGRIIEPKGVHLAIAAVKLYNTRHKTTLQLRIAGKYYGDDKDTYWQERVLPHIDGHEIVYEGFVDSIETKQIFLGNASALLVPSIFEEPFGMVSIEALACGTPVIGLDSGAIPEVLHSGHAGTVVKKVLTDSGDVDVERTAQALAAALESIEGFDRAACRREFEQRFTAKRMCLEHVAAYRSLAARTKN